METSHDSCRFCFIDFIILHVRTRPICFINRILFHVTLWSCSVNLHRLNAQFIIHVLPEEFLFFSKASLQHITYLLVYFLQSYFKASLACFLICSAIFLNSVPLVIRESFCDRSFCNMVCKLVFTRKKLRNFWYSASTALMFSLTICEAGISLTAPDVLGLLFK